MFAMSRGVAPAEERTLAHHPIDVLVRFGERGDALRSRCPGSDGVHPDSVLRVLRRHRTGHARHPALRRGIAVASTERHEGDVGRRVDDRAAAGFDESRNSVLAAEKGAEEIEADDPPELFFGRLGDRPVDLGGASRVVVHHVEPAELVHRPVERGPDAGSFGNVGLDPEGLAARAPDSLRCFRAGGRIDLGHHDARALAGEQFRCRATDAGPRAGDECDLAFEPIAHDVWFPGWHVGCRQRLWCRRRTARKIAENRHLPGSRRHAVPRVQLP